MKALKMIDRLSPQAKAGLFVVVMAVVIWVLILTGVAQPHLAR